ncbi:MAG: hypothetical protein FJ033_15840 [Chloroflexi bacterium]|nr:hypothetical protein [Chloroflexota bacterium]
MPYCTECGARHAETARTCPRCSQAIAPPPLENDLDDVLASLDDDVAAIDAEPGLPPGADDARLSDRYLEEIQGVRAEIAAQSEALQALNDLSWENESAASVRDHLSSALERLRQMTPPPELDEIHRDFVSGAVRLVHGFVSLENALAVRESGPAVEAAQTEIAEANDHFRRGADALSDYILERSASYQAGAAESMAANRPNTEGDDRGLPGLDDDDDAFNFSFDDEDDASSTGDASGDDSDLDLPPLEVGEESDDVTAADLPAPAEDDLPDLPPDLAELDLGEDPAMPEPVAIGGPIGVPAPPVETTAPPRAAVATSPPSSVHAPAGSRWPDIGDAPTDSLLLDIEGGWVRGRPQVYDAIERAIRSAVVDALRNAMQSRTRVEEEARLSLRRIGTERKRLLDEVDALRREAHDLQVEATEIRRILNDLERERQLATERRSQMFQETEAHRIQLLTEIEQLGGQLEAMRRNIVDLLRLSSSRDDEAGGSERTPPVPTTIRITGVGPANRAALEIAIEEIGARGGFAMIDGPRTTGDAIEARFSSPEPDAIIAAISGIDDPPVLFKSGPEGGTIVFSAL